MAAQKRQLSHPSHKCEEMRSTITRLCQDEDRQLKDIIEIFAGQGFVAKSHSLCGKADSGSLTLRPDSVIIRRAFANGVLTTSIENCVYITTAPSKADSISGRRTDYCSPQASRQAGNDTVFEIHGLKRSANEVKSF
jgi:hypothetical protein